MLAAALLAAVQGCPEPDHTPVKVPDSRQAVFHAPIDHGTDVDILFVVGTPNCMGEEQAQLARSFPALLDALRSPCFKAGIPNLHVGIVSTNLGAGSYFEHACRPGGDGGRLQHAPRVHGCRPPSEPYIAHLEGVTNVEGSTRTSDAVKELRQAFECIAQLGTSGCRYIHALESARRALDPALGVNPGFLRKGALRAVVFVTNMDDCSAANTKMFDPSPAAPDSLLGPPCLFRCFDLGYECECGGGPCDRYSAGPRTGCRPAGRWLHPVESYVSFFDSLGPPGRVLLYAVAAPDLDAVETMSSGGCMHVKRACTTSIGAADPTLRIKALMDRFGERGFYNTGLDKAEKPTEVSICSADYQPALRFVGRSIVAALTSRCIPGPLLIPAEGGSGAPSVACHAGDRPGPPDSPACPRSCLDQAQCTVERVSPTGPGVPIARCPAHLFDDPAARDCGRSCPCWRIVASPDCNPQVVGSPHAVEILDRSPAPGALVRIECLLSTHPWGNSQIASLPMCEPRDP